MNGLAATQHFGRFRNEADIDGAAKPPAAERARRGGSQTSDR